MKIWNFYSFALLSVVHLLALFFQQEAIIFWTKMGLMPLLWWHLWASVAPEWNVLQRWVSIGLVFAFGGDTLLLFAKNPENGQTFFLLGLISFLICHIFYIIGFVRFKSQKQGFLSQKPIFIAPFVAYIAMMLSYLLPNIPSAMKIPVVVYSLVIATMAMAALHLRTRLTRGEAWYNIVGGALLFIVSDSILAVNKFGTIKYEWFGLAIMITYIFGQYFIVRGAIKTK